MDRFDAMRAFCRIVERGSFTRAAEDLGLPRSSVTDAVKDLEARLGTRLLQRTTRHVSPTLDGEAYRQRCLRLLADLEEAEGAFAGGAPRGPLHVAVHPTLASHFVVPHLPGFLAEHPGVELFFGEGDRYVDLVREGFDCAVRVGGLADSGDLVARRLAALAEATCASPSYLARHGVPEHVDGLDGHGMVGFRSSATGAVLPLEFTVAGRVRAVSLPVSVAVGGAETYAAAARAGLGLIQAPRY
ncbi:MAG: LysR family transcriptional regulator, partial [Acetobacteraceae bacterium]|nr:LysR family transcriptional regulator [Acetobacteraceae bacterium]